VSTKELLACMIAGVTVFLHGCGEEFPLSSSEPGLGRPVYTESREPCDSFDPYRNLYFGDLHAHTSLSHETWLLDIRSTPRDAYRFARGEPLSLPPLNEDGQGTRWIQIDRPLDFAAVTDHGEFLGEVKACTSEGEPGYDSLPCAIYRDENLLSEIVMAFPTATADPRRSEEICGQAGSNCLAPAKAVWRQVVEEAEEAYDRSSTCSFTTFAAYEYTGMPAAANFHRNVIFRNASVPDLPVSYFEEPMAEGLWAALKRECLEDLPGCDVLAIPHNSNESNGNKFDLDPWKGAEEPDRIRERAAVRAATEPVVEIFQNKGDSECMNGLAGVPGESDPLCGFEKLHKPPFADCGEEAGFGGVVGVGCVSRLDFVRNVLLAGLEIEERLGVNPYKLGIAASTDTHNAAPGLVTEDGYPGQWGIRESTPEQRLGSGGITHQGVVTNPGGLTAVWAVENSRDAIFEALRRRETYGTSGPRIRVRFFAGWDFPESLCEDPGADRIGYRRGAPMGGDLPPKPAGAAKPTLYVCAEADPLGAPLQRIQIIKGWIDSIGGPMLRVFDVAGDPANGATVDLETCQTLGAGFSRLCTVWTDAGFHPGERAFYYARVLQNPTCRWSTHECNRLAPEERPPACQDPDVPKVIQERAWTSPVWYRP